MSTNVPFGKDSAVTATLLLAAAADLDLDPSVVRTSPTKREFTVPDEVAKQVEAQNKKAEANRKAEAKTTGEEKKAPAKKTAKKAAPKKSAEPKTATNKKVE